MNKETSVFDKDPQEQVCLNQTLKLLSKTKADIFKIWQDAGFDFACFDVKIQLKVVVDDVTLQVSEGWDKV